MYSEWNNTQDLFWLVLPYYSESVLYQITMPFLGNFFYLSSQAIMYPSLQKNDELNIQLGHTVQQQAIAIEMRSSYAGNTLLLQYLVSN